MKLEFVHLIYICQVSSGVALTIFVKLQDKQRIDGVFFQHGYLQSLISFLGQTFNFVIYKAQQKYQQNDLQEQKIKAEAEGKKVELPLARLILPGIFHSLCQIMGFAAYFHIQASISMMMGGSLPIITAILSRIFFNRVVNRQQICGMAVIAAGCVILGIVANQNQEQLEEANALLGITLSILSLLFFAFLMIAEEYLLKNYFVYSTLIAGTEGSTALFIGFLSIPLINLFSTDFINVQLFKDQISKSDTLFYSCFAILFADMFYTLFCILATKHSSSLTRSIICEFLTIFFQKQILIVYRLQIYIYQLRIIGVWCVALFLPNPDYIPQDTWETFQITQFCAYLLLILGMIIYNGNITIKALQDEIPLITPVQEQKDVQLVETSQELQEIKQIQ